jgi:hypothetical protein
MRTRDSSRTIIWGNWADDSVVVGLDTSLITVDTIYSYNQFWTLTGDVVVQPPYHYDLQIPFSDMDRAHFRFYGIGDPLAPNRIYYTPVDTVSWYVYDYFEIEPGADKFIALEQLNDVLYAFKHRTIWFLAGYAAEVETMWGRLTDSEVEVRQLSSHFGALSREAVCKYLEAIYFMSSHGKVMVIDGQGLRELSLPIENRIDTLFPEFSDLVDHAHLVGVDDCIKLTNDSSGKVLSFHIPSGTWVREKFTGFVPERAFIYDSTDGGTEYSEIHWGQGTGHFRRQYDDTRFDAAGLFEWAAEFPVNGDGFGLWNIQQLSLRQEARSLWWLRYTIYDSDGDSLASDSIYQGIGGNPFLRWHTLEHDAVMYPFLRLWGKTGENTGGGDPQTISNLFEIDNVTIMVRSAGLNEVK